jgi:hypothetical protein
MQQPAPPAKLNTNQDHPKHSMRKGRDYSKLPDRKLQTLLAECTTSLAPLVDTMSAALNGCSVTFEEQKTLSKVNPAAFVQRYQRYLAIKAELDVRFAEDKNTSLLVLLDELERQGRISGLNEAAMAMARDASVEDAARLVKFHGALSAIGAQHHLLAQGL